MRAQSIDGDMNEETRDERDRYPESADALDGQNYAPRNTYSG